jgi:small subunit ribosomal protein S4
MGLSRTRSGARQLVNHGHILVDGSKVDIPSYRVKPGQVISLKETSRNLKVVKESLETLHTVPAYVTFDNEKLEGTYVRLPERSELSCEIDESLIVEYYNRLD